MFRLASKSMTASVAIVRKGFSSPSPNSSIIWSSNLLPVYSSGPVISRYLSTRAVIDNTSISENSRKYRFFQDVEYVHDGEVAVIRFDNPDKPVNTISFAMKDEAKKLWDDEIHSNPGIKAVVFSSGKESGFIAGADIGDIKSIEDKKDLVPIIKDGLDFFQKMKTKGVPLVCAIHGPALGGGLEWALWCDYRICSDSSKTKMGLPEVKLGLLPGFGGTQNLYPLVGLQEALGMMLQGKEVRPQKAKKIGLVDMVVAPQSLEKVAVASALALANGTLKHKKKKKPLMNWALENNPIGRNIVLKKAKEMVDKAGSQYPSPYAIMECVKYGLQHPSGNDKYKFEREEFAKLAATNEASGLIGIFEGMTSLKKHNFGEKIQPVDRVAVLGAGLMGAGIAQVTAEKGFTVLLKDKDDAGIARGSSYIQGNWEKKSEKKENDEVPIQYKHIEYSSTYR